MTLCATRPIWYHGCRRRLVPDCLAWPLGELPMNHRTTSHAIVLCLIASLHAQPYPYPRSAEMIDAKAGDVILKPGTLQGYAADFGTLVVPENREKKDSRLIRITVVRMRSRRGPGLDRERGGGGERGG